MVYVLVCVQVSIHVVIIGTAHPDELVVLRRVLLNLLIDLNLKLFKLLLHFVVDVPLVDQEIIRIILLLLLGVINVLAKLPNVIDCRLNHAGRCDILTERLVALQLGLRRHLRIVHARTVHLVHLRLVPRVVHVVAEALVLRRIVKLLRISLLHS